MLSQLITTIPANILPVDLNLARRHCRITNTAELDLLTLYLQTAAQMAEQYTNRTLINTTYLWNWTKTFPTLQWPMVAVPVPILPMGIEYYYNSSNFFVYELPRSPSVTVNSIVLNNYGDTQQLLVENQDYYFDTTVEPGRIRMIQPIIWETVSSMGINFTAGYGTSISDIPVSIRNAILLMTSALYENRGDNKSEQVISGAAESLLDMYRMVPMSQ